MPTVRITDATVEPISVAAAKRHLHEDLVDAENDMDIGALITTVRTDCENRLQRTLITTTWRLTLDAFPDHCTGYADGLIRLSMGPFIGVEWVKYVDADGTLQTLATTEWLAELSGDMGLIGPAYGKNWPATRAQPGAVQVQYTAGYGSAEASVPAPIRHWLKLALTDLYEQRARSAERPAVPMQFADGLLDAYRIWSM